MCSSQVTVAVDRDVIILLVCFFLLTCVFFKKFGTMHLAFNIGENPVVCSLDKTDSRLIWIYLVYSCT